MITFLHVSEASQKTPSDGGLNGRSFIRGKSMDDNLLGSTIDSIIAEGRKSSIRVIFGGQFKEVADRYRFISLAFQNCERVSE